MPRHFVAELGLYCQRLWVVGMQFTAKTLPNHNMLWSFSATYLLVQSSAAHELTTPEGPANLQGKFCIMHLSG